jgi:hypothetical protein
MIGRTWRVTADLAEEINKIASQYGVWPSDLVRYLLTCAIAMHNAGRLTIPTCPAGRPNRIDWGQNRGQR